MLHGLLWILVFSFFAHAGFSGLLAIWIAGHFLGQIFGFAVSVACVTMHVMGLHWMSLDWILFHMRGSNLVSFCLQPLRGNVFAAQEQRHGDVSGWFWNCTATRRTARCCFGSSVSCTGLRRGMLFFLLAGTMRIGEALHPGPPPGSTWTLGIANPSGLNGKLDQVNHLPGDAWIFSETQLSQRGVSAFAKGLDASVHGGIWLLVPPVSPVLVLIQELMQVSCWFLVFRPGLFLTILPLMLMPRPGFRWLVWRLRIHGSPLACFMEFPAMPTTSRRDTRLMPCCLIWWIALVVKQLVPELSGGFQLWAF